MSKVSEHFRRDEFECQCGCGYDTVDADLIKVLEVVRNKFNKPVIVNSAARCLAHNDSVGGYPNSQHLVGKAADIVVQDISPTEVYRFLNLYAPHKLGLGEYLEFTHVDVRNGKARWAG